MRTLLYRSILALALVAGVSAFSPLLGTPALGRSRTSAASSLKMVVPRKDSYKITNLPGDGIGPEVMVEARKVLEGGAKSGHQPPLWDGRAAARIVDVLERDLGDKV